MLCVCYFFHDKMFNLFSSDVCKRELLLSSFIYCLKKCQWRPHISVTDWRLISIFSKQLERTKLYEKKNFHVCLKVFVFQKTTNYGIYLFHKISFFFHYFASSLISKWVSFVSDKIAFFSLRSGYTFKSYSRRNDATIQMWKFKFN